MKVKSYALYVVPPRWMFLKIETEDGLVGWGEPMLEGATHQVKAAVKDLMETYVMDKDIRHIEDIWTVSYRGQFYRASSVTMSALSGIDQALWDIKGKFYNTPVYMLLGGACRNSIRAYSWVGGDRPGDTAHMAKERKDQGFTAVKMNATEELQYIDTHKKIDAVLENVSEIRSTCGKDFGIGVDFHGRVHKPMAKVLAKKLEEYDLMFIEEPVLCDNMESFRDVAMHSNIPIATGERLYSRWEFKKILQEGYVDIIQPDLSHAGGITEVKKIAAMAEAYDVAFAPHCPLGPVALASCIQVDAVSYNAVIQEQSIGIHYNKGNDVLDYITNPEVFSFKDGYLSMPQGPGLGVNVNEQFLKEKSQTEHNWKNPIWRHKDGSFAEW